MPQAIGAVIAAAITGSTIAAATGTFLATAIGYAVVTGALVGAQLLLAPKPDIPKPSDGKQTIKQSIPAVVYAFGRVRLSGAYLAYEMKGSTSYDVLAIHQGEIDAYEYFYLHEDIVSFDAGQVDGGVNAADGVKYRRAADDPTVQIFWRRGLATETAYAQMVAVMPEKWTVAHRGDGIATILLITKSPSEKQFQKRLPFGLPKPSAVVRGVKAWDPRDPAQIEADRSTWKWTENPIVQLLHYYCHHKSGFRRAVAKAYAPTSAWWLAAMDCCDEAVPLKGGGTEKRYRAWGQWTSESPRKSVVGALMRACDGWFAEAGDGSVIVYAGEYHEPTITIGARHVVDLNIDKERDEDEDFNQLVVKFTSQDHDFNEVEADPWVAQDEIDAGRPIVSAEARAEWAPSFTQARRLAKSEFSRLRCAIRGTLKTNLYGGNLKGRRYFMLNLGDMESTQNVPCEVVDLVDNSFENGTWDVEFRSVDPSRYVWDELTEEGKRPAIPDRTEDDELPIPPIPALVVIRETIGGSPVAKISASSPPVENWSDISLTGRYRKTGATAWLAMAAPEEDVLRVLSAAVEDGSYEVQTAYIGGGGSDGEWSPIATITVVSDNVAPLAPDPLMAPVAGPAVTFSARAPNAHVTSMEFRRGTTAQAFAAATLIFGPANCTPNQVLSAQDAPGVGTWRYWAVARNGSGLDGPAAYFDATVV